ncbi:MAG: DUF2393 domain-containing protein [Epsilonproteobacteria bacterium]|nr:DUF2393 domain-containing protein [Campylobacterota bacterium]
MVTFINGLILYDYILFGATLLLFLLFIILAIVVRHRLGVALFFIFFGFLLLFTLPTLGYIEMHKYLFKSTATLTSQKLLSFSEAIVVKGEITNESKFDFSECAITASAYKVSGNELKDFLFKLKPLKKMTIVENNITKGSTKEFKLFIEPFRYAKDYNVSLEATCR